MTLRVQFLPINLNAGEYLSDQIERVRQYLNEYRSIFIHANPSVGKTRCLSRISEQVKASGNKSVFAAPFKSLMLQAEKDFGKWDLFCYHDDPKYSKRSLPVIQDGELNIVSTFQQVANIIEELSEDDILIIDEAHYLVELAHDTNVIATRRKLLDAKCKVVFLSGTPYRNDLKRLGVNACIMVSETSSSKSTIHYIEASSVFSYFPIAFVKFVSDF